MQARRLRRQRRRRSKMDAKNPVIPWSELEGQFFKVDVGSTNGDAYLSDIRTGKPVVHYTTEGDIVFNGVKFTRNEKAINYPPITQMKCIVCHKSVPPYPRRGYIYAFEGVNAIFKVDNTMADFVFRPSIYIPFPVDFVYYHDNKGAMHFCNDLSVFELNKEVRLFDIIERIPELRDVKRYYIGFRINDTREGVKFICIYDNYDRGKADNSQLLSNEFFHYIGVLSKSELSSLSFKPRMAGTKWECVNDYSKIEYSADIKFSGGYFGKYTYGFLRKRIRRLDKDNFRSNIFYKGRKEIFVPTDDNGMNYLSTKSLYSFFVCARSRSKRKLYNSPRKQFKYTRKSNKIYYVKILYKKDTRNGRLIISRIKK
jgi:hypothetical protein